jgi:hypothetical protein
MICRDKCVPAYVPEVGDQVFIGFIGSGTVPWEIALVTGDKVWTQRGDLRRYRVPVASLTLHKRTEGKR